jgi:hypothetical protein
MVPDALGRVSVCAGKLKSRFGLDRYRKNRREAVAAFVAMRFVSTQDGLADEVIVTTPASTTIVIVVNID